MNPLRRLLECHGSFGSYEMENSIIADFPNLIVGVKMGCSPRFLCPIKDARARIKALEKVNSTDYCREIFLPVGVFDALRSALGMTDK